MVTEDSKDNGLEKLMVQGIFVLEKMDGGR